MAHRNWAIRPRSRILLYARGAFLVQPKTSIRMQEGLCRPKRLLSGHANFHWCLVPCVNSTHMHTEWHHSWHCKEDKHRGRDEFLCLLNKTVAIRTWELPSIALALAQGDAEPVGHNIKQAMPCWRKLSNTHSLPVCSISRGVPWCIPFSIRPYQIDRTEQITQSRQYFVVRPYNTDEQSVDVGTWL